MSAPADLRAVEALCRLAVAARALGCRIHLTGTDPALRGVLERAGVRDVLGDCPAERRGGVVPPGPVVR